MIKGRVHSIESFGAVDGPGVRIIIFLQGCMMRCQYCHNADTWDINGNNLVSADELLDQAERYRSYWGKEGGITVSGGEALLQIDFLLELFKKAKERNINTTLDTCGQPFTREEPFFSKFEELMQYTDLILMDLKHIDSEEHKKLTGWTNENILDMFKYLSQKNVPIWVRQVLVPGITDQDKYLFRTRDFISKLRNVKKIEVLPYHSMGAFKWENRGMQYPLKGVKSPSAESVTRAQKILDGTLTLEEAGMTA